MLPAHGCLASGSRRRWGSIQSCRWLVLGLQRCLIHPSCLLVAIPKISKRRIDPCCCPGFFLVLLFFPHCCSRRQMWLRQLPGSGSLLLASPTNCLQTSWLSGPLFWSIRGCYRSSANCDDHIQALHLKPPGSAGLDEEAHLHGVVNSLYVLISVTICVLAWAGETGALGIYSRR